MRKCAQDFGWFKDVMVGKLQLTYFDNAVTVTHHCFSQILHAGDLVIVTTPCGVDIRTEVYYCSLSFVTDSPEGKYSIY